MNEERFTGRADIYERYRSGYPEALMHYLYTEVGLRGDSAVADIGAGTGILTELLLRRGSRVFAVEPNGDMRSTAERKLSRYPGYVSVNAAAEATGLPDDSVDFVAVATAFHWFDKNQFRNECRRILKDDGKAILIWNVKDMASELVRESAQISREFCPGVESVSDGIHNLDNGEFARFFRDGQYDTRSFPNPQQLDEDGFVGRSLSSSYAPSEGADAYEPYVEALRALFKRYAEKGTLWLEQVTKSYVGVV